MRGTNIIRSVQEGRRQSEKSGRGRGQKNGGKCNVDGFEDGGRRIRAKEQGRPQMLGTQGTGFPHWNYSYPGYGVHVAAKSNDFLEM